jgi:hypothetical protein
MGLSGWLFGKKDRRPSARRVAGRAMVLSTVVCRAYLEREHHAGIHENAEGRWALLAWLDECGLGRELEPGEIDFLSTNVGESSVRTAVNAFWRTEGLGVLAWSLGRFELPPYDQLTNPDAAQKAVGFLREPGKDDPRKSGVLRPAEEIRRFASHITIVSWRLRQFRIDPARAFPSFDVQIEGDGPVPVEGSLAERKLLGTGVGEGMDFEAYLRAHPRFREDWLDGLPLIDGDLAIGDRPIADAEPDEVDKCTSIAVERQIAAYWLEGDEPTYSAVNPSTFLSAC